MKKIYCSHVQYKYLYKRDAPKITTTDVNRAKKKIMIRHGIEKTKYRKRIKEREGKGWTAVKQY
jgi:hypothetical protein